MTEKTEATANEKERHHARKQRHKEIVDARISAATQQRGVILVHTGSGKGKSSSAFGMMARALGHNMRVGVVQFIKGSFPTGEETFFRRFPEVEYHVMGEGYTWETQDRERDIAKAQAAWQVAHDMLRNPDLQLVVLDEINIALKLRYVEIAQVLDALRSRPAMQHVVLTGRGAPDALIEIADTVTEMRPVKHAFDADIQAQEGIEF
ncbi:MAG TPA: cob(I)yrinic acid a,c-diamide adenosyltransferase [Gallionella sp.]|jgi:cob(I)alamin adenosyltransferase|nr:cob(I)yrinic acid a,c-diamide adenosyltransferase [Gallionella sp.]